MIPGPAYFPLWPRQSHTVISGHQLRSNQYLLVRVYNDHEAAANWDKAVIKKASHDSKSEVAKPEQLTTGQLLIIKGTEVSFYIPPTGIEVVADRVGNFVREAVTLERMEFCILKEERGEKRYVQGPDVVFPSPTETFVEMNGEMKFKPIELTPISGLYIKVIADYTEGGTEYKKGDELFITGNQQAIYYPRPEHNIIKYGDRTVHHAVAVPRGEGRYVLNRETGEVGLIKGPLMLLPDPRREVIVRRVLDANQVSLMYPGNQQALEVNKLLKAELESSPKQEATFSRGLIASAASAMNTFAGDALTRSTSYNPPRTITLDTKYDGAVAISLYSGFAVLIVNKSGDRKVVEGPAAILLEYDETLMPMALSTGKPKTNNTLIHTVYLQVKNNRISDKIMGVETKDLVRVDITLAYRVHFEGNDPLKWFQVDNYVHHLVEHGRSMLRNAVKQVGIEEFYNNPIAMVRDTLLGPASDNESRRGLVFKENGMRVYDVDVLMVEIEDSKIASLLETAQEEVIATTLVIAGKERELQKVMRVEEINRNIEKEQAITVATRVDLEIEKAKNQLKKRLEELTGNALVESSRLQAEEDRLALVDNISTAELARRKAEKDQEIEFTRQEIEQELKRLHGETEEIVQRSTAVSEKLISALQAFGDKALLEKVAEAMAPLAILRNSGVVEAFTGLLKGTPYADILLKSTVAKVIK